MADDFMAMDDLTDVEDAATALLSPKKNRLSKLKAEAASRKQKAQKHSTSDDAAPEPATVKLDKQAQVPDFLANAAKPAAEAAKVPAPPTEIKRPGDGDESYELPPLTILKAVSYTQLTLPTN